MEINSLGTQEVTSTLKLGHSTALCYKGHILHGYPNISLYSKVVLGGFSEIFFGVKVENVKLIGGR